MKMRLAWYAGASTALAGAVVVSAFHQRANFYAAMVHLAQSSLSLMILVNLVFLIYGSFMYGLQRLLYGQLRPVEIEQLYEKAWFAVTETCLAMTIFREEVGAFFLVMFTALVTGKVWGWIGEGRVEVLEQQPPANPWLFHTRLSLSLLLSVLYDTWLLSYAVNTVVQQARPTMMVMFLFEFAVLTVCSFHTGFRYIMSLVEQRVVKTQTRQRLEDRRRQIREQNAEILRRREIEGNTEGENQEPLPSEDDVDEIDIEVPGWQSKGLWVLSLDLFADFVKLGIYTTFFCVLFTFYGLPIHIMRDWFMTTRSFLKRLNALIRYRQALKDMDQYPDATAEDLGREDTCIICREEMRPWDPNDLGQLERSRPRKLPCGHILHHGCLKSWLERQQVCPTCRSPVVRGAQGGANNGEAMVFRFGLNIGQNQQQGQAPANGQAPGAAAGQAAQGGHNGARNNRNGVRMFNLGPLRLGFAQGGVQDIQDMAQRLGLPDDAVPAVATPAPQQQPQAQQHEGGAHPSLDSSLDNMRNQLMEFNRRIQQDMQTLQNTAQEVQVLNVLVQELARLRQMQQYVQAQQQPQQPQLQQPTQQPQQTTQQPQQTAQAQSQPGSAANTPGAHVQQNAQAGQAPWPPGPVHAPLHHLPPYFPQQAVPLGPIPPAMPGFPFHVPSGRPATTTVTRHSAANYGSAIPAGSSGLPEGVVIPPGWSLLPLQRMDGAAPPADSAPVNPQNLHLNEMLQTFGGIHARPSRAQNTSTAANQGSEAAERPRDTIQATDVTSAGPTASQQAPPQPDEPQVTAPTPMMPNWAGSNQLFGGNSTGVFGLQPYGSSAPGSQDEGGSSTTATQDLGSSSAAPHPTASEASANGGTGSDKGKGKAVTVEDAKDEDEAGA